MNDPETKLLNKLLDRLVEERAITVENIRQWTDRVHKNLDSSSATYPWSNSDAIFLAAAKNSVFTQVIEAVRKKLGSPEDSKLTLASLESYALEEVCKRGGSPTHSTSVTNNFTRAMEGSAWEKVLRHVRQVMHDLPKARNESLRELLAEWEEEHGAFTEEEIAKAERLLGAQS